MPLYLYDENGGHVWDTDSVTGGVFVGIWTFQAGDTGTFDYTAFAGRAGTIVNLNDWNSTGDINVSVNHDPGCPRMVVSTSVLERRVALLVK